MTEKAQTIKWVVVAALKLVAAFLLGKYGVDIAKHIDVDVVAVQLTTMGLAVASIYTSVKDRKKIEDETWDEAVAETTKQNVL